MRITGRDKACGTAFSSRVDKMISSLPRGGRKRRRRRRRKHGVHCHGNLYPFHKLSYTRMCIHSTYLSLSQSLCACTRYARWTILQQVSDCFVGFSPRRFPVTIFLFGVFIVLARQGFFKGWVGLLLQGVSRRVRGAVRLYWSGTV